MNYFDAYYRNSFHDPHRVQHPDLSDLMGADASCQANCGGRTDPTGFEPFGRI